MMIGFQGAVVLASILLLIPPAISKSITSDRATTSIILSERFPKRIVSRIGQHSFSSSNNNNNDITSLQSIDSTSYVILTPKVNRKYKGNFIISKPYNIDLSKITELQFKMVVKFSNDVGGENYKFKLRNYANKKWEMIKTTKSISATTNWKVLIKSIKIIDFNSYLNLKSGKITIQIVSRKDNDSLLIDYFGLFLVGEKNTSNQDFISLVKPTYGLNEGITVTYQTNNDGINCHNYFWNYLLINHSF